jgi:hypothetical protein
VLVLLLLISTLFAGRLRLPMAVGAIEAAWATRMIPLVLEPLLSMAVEATEEGATVAWGWRTEVPVLLLLTSTLFVGRPAGADVAEATKTTRTKRRKRYIQRVRRRVLDWTGQENRCHSFYTDG